MTKKSVITESQLRQIVRENIALAYIEREQKILNEWVAATLAAIPKIAKYAPVIFGAVKTFTGGGSSSASPENLSKVIDMGMSGAPGATGNVTAVPGVAPISFSDKIQQYSGMAGRARDMAQNIFGNPQNSQHVQQAVGSMGQDLGRIGDQGIQAVFGKNNPQQMIDMSIAINSGNLGDAALLYGAMKGLGTDEKVVRDVIARRSSDLKGLSSEFAQFITRHPDEKDTDLLSWLKGDGLPDEAKLVAMATGVYKKGGLFGSLFSS